VEEDGAINDILAVVTVREMAPVLAERALALAREKHILLVSSPSLAPTSLS